MLRKVFVEVNTQVVSFDNPWSRRPQVGLHEAVALTGDNRPHREEIDGRRFVFHGMADAKIGVARLDRMAG